MKAVTEQLGRTSMEAKTRARDGAGAGALGEREREEAQAFLASLLNRTLRVYATDGRMFLGTFKCTDTHCNVVLAMTHEYRPPSPQKLAAMSSATSSGADRGDGGGPAPIIADMPSRYLGLVVIPGSHVVRMEVEEFVSQLRHGRSIFERKDIYGGGGGRDAAAETTRVV
ncbi:hypothetical protein GGR56DRAFT_648510 [Xylariaceae sp. FL0804]|nr:hypothetical protein GGR56DRAFT_648510 [Xylariaceae sp. FL0804]